MRRSHVACALMLIFGLPSTLASAQDTTVTAAILQSQRTGVTEGLGAAFDRTLRARLDALGVVASAGAVALDLDEIQLALGCMGETVECLSAVAAEMEATLVLVPSLAQAGATTQATVLVFDSRDSSMRRTTREVDGANSEAQLLAGTEGLLRELFGLPPAQEQIGPDEISAPTSPRASALSPAPFIFIGGGAAALLAGIVAGVLSAGDAGAYARARPTTAAEVDGTLARFSQAETEALAANILYVVGGVLVAAGITWELAAGREDGTSPLSLAPWFGPSSVGLALNGDLGVSL